MRESLWWLPEGRRGVSARMIMGCILALLAGTIDAGGLDNRSSGDPSGFWQHGSPLYHALTAATVGGALFLGNEDRLGKTLWNSTDALIVTAAASEVLKRSGGRLRPRETENPDQWGEGGTSFPSRHVAASAAMVTPLILEYADQHPAAMALYAIPVYEMVSRVKMRAHWQSDVIAGALLGTAIGYYSHGSGPLFISVLPQGVFMGIRQRLR